jgi:hypothetical protein
MLTVIQRGRMSEGQIAIQSLESAERKKLFAGSHARYLPTGHLVYAIESNLFATPFDLDRLQTMGGPVSVVEGVFHPAAMIPPASSISDSGTLVYVPGIARRLAESTLVWVDRSGKVEEIATDPKDYVGPRISPDGKKVALTIQNGDKGDIWI